MSDADLEQQLQDWLRYDALTRENPLDYFFPYDKQKEFLRLGSSRRERLFLAGNRIGKTHTGCFETAAHILGDYPDWFEGRRFNHPTTGWVCGASGESIRDILQLKLFDVLVDPTRIGFIPRSRIVGRPALDRGTSGLIDTVYIRHSSGGLSTLSFKSYKQSLDTWMGSELDFVHIDEEPPDPKHYHEALSRLTPRGLLWVTFTPLGGMTDLLCRFLQEEDPEAAADRAVVQMSLDEVEHFSEAEKATRIRGYSLVEREARRYGTPMLGAGRVFQFSREALAVDQDIVVQPHWRKLWGTDFGGFGDGHPFAAALVALDPDTDTLHVIDTVRLRSSRPVEHARAMLAKSGSEVPVAWPFDGNKKESSREPVVKMYRNEGLRMLPSHATFPDGSISTEAGLTQMETRMAEGRFRVRANLTDWWEEFGGYHRMDDGSGRLVRERDDLMSATRVAVMQLRSALAVPLNNGVYAPGIRRRKPQKFAKGIDFDLFR